MVAARDARQHQHPVLGEGLHRVEHERREAGRLENQIERPVLRRDVEERAFLGGYVAGAQRFDEIGIEVRAALSGERRDLDPPQA